MPTCKPSKHLFLTGFMGSGKTTVGRLLARELGTPFIDLDAEIERAAGREITQIFAQDGESTFRQLEHEVLLRFCRSEPTVVATGGGAILRSDNRWLMRSTGTVIHLQVEYQTVANRLAGDRTRPLLQNQGQETARRLLDARQKYYADADLSVRVDGKSPEQIMKEIIELMQQLTPQQTTVLVELADRSYPIVIGTEVLPSMGNSLATLTPRRTVVIITNDLVAQKYHAPVVESLAAAGFSSHTMCVPDGEVFKSAETLAAVYDGAFNAGLDRGGLFLALGGGVVGDLTGYAAATFMRGVPFVQVPTTLLAQVDSSVGGKTGINHPRGKNLIGAFHQPLAVYADVTTLQTLSDRDYATGLAEVVKYGMSQDAEFFAYLEDNSDLIWSRDAGALQLIVAQSCRLKAHIVTQDERESSLRAVLNYGHTFGHAIESLTAYQQFTHGEAVAIGMVQAARIAVARGFAEPQHLERLIRLLQRFSLPIDLPDFTAQEYEQAIRLDKKVREGALTFVLNRGIGDFTFSQETNLQNLLAILTKDGESV